MPPPASGSSATLYCEILFSLSQSSHSEPGVVADHCLAELERRLEELVSDNLTEQGVPLAGLDQPRAELLKAS